VEVELGLGQIALDHPAQAALDVAREAGMRQLRPEVARTAAPCEREDRGRERQRPAGGADHRWASTIASAAISGRSSAMLVRSSTQRASLWRARSIAVRIRGPSK